MVYEAYPRSRSSFKKQEGHHPHMHTIARGKEAQAGAKYSFFKGAG